jgi:hypothetical protein
MAKGEIFSGLPSWAKGVISVAVVGAAAFVAYKIYQKIKEKEEKKSAIDENKTVANEAKVLANLGVKPTLTAAMLNNAVNGIKQSWLEYDAITRPHTQKFYHELVKVKNDLDILNLITAYGIQTIDFPITKFTVNDFTGNLTQSAKNFLNNKEISVANMTLAKKGIKYRF